MLEQIFKPNKEKLKLKDIEIDISNETVGNVEEASEDRDRFPQVYYNGYKLQRDTYSLEVNFNNFLPTISISYIDVMGIIYKHGLPIDDSKIMVMLPSNNKALGNILMEFKIEKYDMETNGKDGIKQYNMAGVLSLNCMFVTDYKVYDMTSYEVFEKFAKDNGLGFVTNISNTNDKMSWNTFGKKNIEFLRDVRNHSWIGEEHFMWAYIDPYYNLVLVDVEAEMKQDPRDIVWFLDSQFSTDEDNDEPVTGSPILTNNDQYQTTNIYIIDYRLVNNSTEVSLNDGYSKKVQYYDVDGNWEDRAGHYYSYGLDAITSPNGDLQIHAKTKDDDFYNKNKSTVYGGMIDTLNVHPDFHYARVQNDYNNNNLDKIVLQATLNKQNFNIQRFGKIQVHIQNNESLGDSNPLIQSLSNDYICTGFIFELRDSTFSTVVNLVSREVNIPNLDI